MKNKVIAWASNLKSITQKNHIENCPFCGSSDTGYSAVKILNDMGYCTMWCNTCKEGIHVSRVKLSTESVKNVTVPSDIKL